MKGLLSASGKLVVLPNICILWNIGTTTIPWIQSAAPHTNLFMHSMYRGGYRRGRGRGGRGGANSSRAEPPPKPCGPEVDTIDIKTLLTEQEAPKIEDVEYITSYN